MKIKRNITLDGSMQLTEKALQELKKIDASGKWEDFKKFTSPMPAEFRVDVIAITKANVVLKFTLKTIFDGWIFGECEKIITLENEESFTLDRLIHPKPLTLVHEGERVQL